MNGKHAPDRSLDEWLGLVTSCRQSSLTDAVWYHENGISPSCFYNAVSRLRKRAFEIPEPSGKASTLDLTSHKQDVVRIVIEPEHTPAVLNLEAFFHPMYEYFHRKLLERNFAMADETPLQVLHEEGRRAQTKSYMWLFRSGEDGDVPIILYKYSPTCAGDNAVEFLQGFDGYLMCDDYSGYNKVSNAKHSSFDAVKKARLEKEKPISGRFFVVA